MSKKEKFSKHGQEVELYLGVFPPYGTTRVASGTIVGNISNMSDYRVVTVDGLNHFLFVPKNRIACKGVLS